MRLLDQERDPPLSRDAGDERSCPVSEQALDSREGPQEGLCHLLPCEIPASENEGSDVCPEKSFPFAGSIPYPAILREDYPTIPADMRQPYRIVSPGRKDIVVDNDGHSAATERASHHAAAERGI